MNERGKLPALRMFRAVTVTSSPEQSVISNTASVATVRRPVFRLVQVLRAIAALMVVGHHATIMLHDRNGVPIPFWLSGAAGVDIFFVISGFVMVISTAPLRHRENPAGIFLVRRIERVLPLYWIATTAKVIVVLAAPALAINTLGGFWHVLSSYLFIPSFNSLHAFEPVVVVGWTLNFEMFFYALFAIALLTRLRPVWLLAPVLPIIGLSWYLFAPSRIETLTFYQNSLLIEFVFGMLLAEAVPLVRRMPAVVSGICAAAGFAMLLSLPKGIDSPFRGILWGIPALAIVLGGVALEEHWGKWAPRWALELGDASYSIYLVHGFVLPLCGIVLLRSSHIVSMPDIALALLVLLVGSVAGGEIVFRAFERPMLQAFARRRRSAIPINA